MNVAWIFDERVARHAAVAREWRSALIRRVRCISVADAEADVELAI